jgi:hypothetical protein
MKAVWDFFTGESKNDMVQRVTETIVFMLDWCDREELYTIDGCLRVGGPHSTQIRKHIFESVDAKISQEFVQDDYDRLSIIKACMKKLSCAKVIAFDKTCKIVFNQTVDSAGKTQIDSEVQQQVEMMIELFYVFVCKIIKHEATSQMNPSAVAAVLSMMMFDDTGEATVAEATKVQTRIPCIRDQLIELCKETDL